MAHVPKNIRTFLAQFLVELVQLVKESNSPIDALWEGILISNIELVRKNLKIIPENYQAPNSLETQVPEHHLMHGFRLGSKLIF